MTIEKVKLTDFTSEELQIVYAALGMSLRFLKSFTPKEVDAIELFRTQIVNANAQRNAVEKTLMN